MGNLSRIFNGYDNVPGIRNLAEFRLNATPGSNDAITKMYAGSTDHPMLAVQARQATAALEFAAARALGSTPKPAAYGDSLIGNKLHQVAELIHADIGLEVAHVTMEHWDTHDDMGTWDAGNVHNLFSMLGTSLAAFHQEAMRSNRNVTLVVMSEFGRRVEQNHSGGTEHGTGGALMVMGQGINGGTIYGTWPGLRRLEYGDLKTTTDYRQVLSEIIANRVGKAHLLPQIFPDYTAPSYLGIS